MFMVHVTARLAAAVRRGASLRGGVVAHFVFAAQVNIWGAQRDNADALTLRTVIGGADTTVPWIEVQKLMPERAAENISMYPVIAWLALCDINAMMQASQHTVGTIWRDVDLHRKAHALSIPVFHPNHSLEYMVMSLRERLMWLTSSELELLLIRYVDFGGVTSHGHAMPVDLLMETLGIKGTRSLVGHVYSEYIRNKFRTLVTKAQYYSAFRMSVIGSTREAGDVDDDGELCTR